MIIIAVKKYYFCKKQTILCINEKILEEFNALINEGYNVVNFLGKTEEQNIQKIFVEVENKLGLFSKKSAKKIFFVSVELLQNIFRHSDHGKTFLYVLNLLGKKIIKITTGNFVDKFKFNQIKSKIEQLNLLSYEELRSLYKKVLANNEFSEKGGGGLGFIDISRKSCLPIELKHIKIDENLYFLIFSVFLENKI